MPNSIEIFQNTLLQLIVRQGTESTRQNVVLKSGELGYTTDTKKLYVGDGTTLGGTLVGKNYAGSATNITTLSPAIEGDLAFDIDNNKLYRLQSNDGSNVSDWELIGGVYSPSNTTLTFSVDNKVSVGTISGANISPNALSNPIHINGSDQIALSARVPLDEVVPKTGDTLKLPNKIQIGSNTFTFSNESYTNGDVFYIDGGEVKTGTLVNSSGIFNTILATGSSNLSGGYRIGQRISTNLPPASANNGLRFEVLDATSLSAGTTLFGGGSANAIVRSNGVNWIIQGAFFV
jgi:hypothetical protein